MSNKFDRSVESESNDDSSDDNSSNDRQDRSRTKSSEKRKKHKKHKKQKKSKKHKKEHLSDGERHSRSTTRVPPEGDDLVPSALLKRRARDSVSPAGSRSAKGGSKPAGREADLLKQVPSRWDSSGEGEHSRKPVDSRATRTYRFEDATMHNNNGAVDKERSSRHSLSHEQPRSTRPSTSGGHAHRFDNREREHDSTGNRHENHYGRTYNKHGSNQQYGRDSSNRSIQQASGSRDNGKKSRSGDREDHRIYHTHDGDQRCHQTDKYNTSNRKRRHGDSPNRQPTGREMSSQKPDNVEHKHMSKTQVKTEKDARHDEEQEHTWGRSADNRSKASKGNANSESGRGSDKADSPVEKEKPNFGLSGKLTEEANKVNGVVIAYAEPSGARKPKRRWRLYPFKGDQALPTLYIHRQSCYLVGRDRRICDLPVDHPSCSKQHAVLQYRLVPYERVDGTKSQCVRPYIIDLESSNGTFVNNKKIEAKRYLELREKDVLKFGFSSREYVLLHENSKEDNEEDEGYDASPAKKPPNESALSKAETK